MGFAERAASSARGRERHSHPRLEVELRKNPEHGLRPGLFGGGAFKAKALQFHGANARRRGFNVR
jgi:hypothetical protein